MSEAVYHDDLDEPSSADREAEVERLRVETNPSVVAKQEQAEKKGRNALKALHDPKRCRSAYLEVAVRSDLTHAEFRCLTVLTTFANQDLSNCFPGKKAIRRALRVEAKNYKAVVGRLLARLQAKGWIRRHAHHRGKKQTSNGIQFLIPDKGAFAGSGWVGPTQFGKRDSDDEKPAGGISPR